MVDFKEKTPGEDNKTIKQLKQNEDIKPFPPEEQVFSVKFYLIPTSYLRGRCVSLVRSLGEKQKWILTLACFGDRV